MKLNSDNFRDSAVNDIINNLYKNNFNVLIYEPSLNKKEYNGCNVVNNFDEFSNKCDVIIANRSTPELNNIKYKVYSRDVYNRD